MPFLLFNNYILFVITTEDRRTEAKHPMNTGYKCYNQDKETCLPVWLQCHVLFTTPCATTAKIQSYNYLSLFFVRSILTCPAELSLWIIIYSSENGFSGGETISIKYGFLPFKRHLVHKKCFIILKFYGEGKQRKHLERSLRGRKDIEKHCH